MIPITISQYRTFDYIYLIKRSNENTCTLRIFDLSQKSLFKQKIENPKDASFPELLINLADKNIIPKTYVPNIKENPLERVAHTIQKYKPQVLVEPKELQKFICPITLDVFKDPVTDNHGHTFEEEAIKEHLQKDAKCPLNREPIQTLSPNLLIKETIESYQKQDPIPTFDLFQKENPKLAKSNLETAQAHLEEEEYEEALNSVKQALKYTKNPKDYALLPTLYKQMGVAEKEILATLYLAKYHIEQGNLKEAISILEAQKPSNLIVEHLLIYLYDANNQPEKFLISAKKLAQELSNKLPEQAILLYKKILQKYPQEFSFYNILAGLVSSYQQRSHIFLMGACHALCCGDYGNADIFINKSKGYISNTFLDDLLTIDHLKLQGKEIKDALKQFAQTYEKKDQAHFALKTHKMLLQIEETEESYQNILNSYKTLKKQIPKAWYTKYLDFLIQNKKWEKGEKIAQEALKIFMGEDSIPIYLNLETIYDNQNSPKLDELYSQLSWVYRMYNLIEASKKVDKKAYERFPTFENASNFAGNLEEENKLSESVQVYFKAFEYALREKKIENLDLCATKIQKVDPQMEYLSPEQKMVMSVHEMLRESRRKVFDLEEELQIVRSEGKDFLTTNFYFGKAEWEKYFGDVGIEPPLPKNIEDILNSPCPFWPGKKVRETHLLVLVPQTINGKPYTINVLGELIKKPKVGNKSRYYSSNGYIQDNLGNQSFASHWILITKEVIPKSQNRSYNVQKELIKNYPLYNLPGTLEVATAIQMYHAQVGEYLYTVDRGEKKIYTQCKEANFGTPVSVGSCKYDEEGISFSMHSAGWADEGCGIGGVRVLFPSESKASSSSIVSSFNCNSPLPALPHLPVIPPDAFGKAKWEKYCTVQSVEPPLPKNIEDILNSPCPIWPNKKIRETHLLFFIPETINGQFLTLNTLKKLINNHPKIKNKITCDLVGNFQDLEGQVYEPEWILITKEIISGTQKKAYSIQEEALRKYSYRPLNILDIATVVVMYYIETGEALYSGSIRCAEKIGDNKTPAGITFGGYGNLLLDKPKLHIHSSSHGTGNDGIGGRSPLV